MSMPIFPIGADPGSSFPELLKRVGLAPELDLSGDALGDMMVPHATTCVALRFADGVVMAGDRRATAGNIISHRTMEKVCEADRYSGVAIAGTADHVGKLIDDSATASELLERLGA